MLAILTLCTHRVPRISTKINLNVSKRPEIIQSTELISSRSKGLFTLSNRLFFFTDWSSFGQDLLVPPLWFGELPDPQPHSFVFERRWNISPQKKQPTMSSSPPLPDYPADIEPLLSP